MNDKNYIANVSLVLLALAICGCGKKKEVVALPPRPVQTIEVPAPKTTLKRSFSGQLETAEGAIARAWTSRSVRPLLRLCQLVPPSVVR